MGELNGNQVIGMTAWEKGRPWIVELFLHSFLYNNSGSR